MPCSKHWASIRWTLSSSASCRALLDHEQSRKDLETTLRRVDGGTVRVALSFWPVYDHQQRTQSFEGVIWNLSEMEMGGSGGLRLDQLASAVSHDLQDPLQLISQYTGLLLERHSGGLEDDAVRLVSRVSESATRMQSMIDGILEFSRISTSSRPFQVVDLNNIVSDAAAILEASINKHQARIECDELYSVVGDPRLLTRLMQNLIGNAVKFHAEDTPRIVISSQDCTEDWLIRVEDNGIGMEPRSAERVFDMFQRLHTTEEYPGTGLGLAICRRIVESHGGRIWVESHPGEGAVFYFTVSKHLKRKLPGDGDVQQAQT